MCRLHRKVVTRQVPAGQSMFELEQLLAADRPAGRCPSEVASRQPVEADLSGFKWGTVHLAKEATFKCQQVLPPANMPPVALTWPLRTVAASLLREERVKWELVGTSRYTVGVVTMPEAGILPAKLLALFRPTPRVLCCCELAPVAVLVWDRAAVCRCPVGRRLRAGAAAL
jgi:hypothetical protein